jgi:hypothetical protein
MSVGDLNPVSNRECIKHETWLGERKREQKKIIHKTKARKKRETEKKKEKKTPTFYSWILFHFCFSKLPG